MIFTLRNLVVQYLKAAAPVAGCMTTKHEIASVFLIFKRFFIFGTIWEIQSSHEFIYNSSSSSYPSHMQWRVLLDRVTCTPYYVDDMLDHMPCKRFQRYLLIALVCAYITSYYVYRHLAHSHINLHNLTSCKMVRLCGSPAWTPSPASSRS